MDAFINLEDIDWSSGDEKADTIYLQWNESWGIWEQVIDEAKGRSGVVEWTRATARAEAEALRSLLAEIVPPKLIGESHDPYPEGKTTIIMDWDWLKRTRAALSKGPTQ